MRSNDEQGGGALLPTDAEGTRKRAALETYVQHEGALRRTAGRYSLCADDAEDALQRALEILLTKAPTDDPRELIRWTQTVVKHEALAVRRDRERILSGPAAAPADPRREDWVALVPADAAGPAERAERHEEIARSREALQALKPQELRALTLLAEGFSYAEIGEITGFSHTKINRSLAEGRERFRRLLSRSEDGRRCVEMRPLLSAFCDGEAGSKETAAVREHLRACAGCRATLRAYRAAPRAAAALAPALPLSRSLFERIHDALGGLSVRLGGDGAATGSQVAAAGGTRGAGIAALAKLVALCVGTAGGAAACIAAGVAPAPLGLSHGRSQPPVLERTLDPVPGAERERELEVEAAPQQHEGARSEPTAAPHEPEPAVQAAAEPAEGGAVEYAEAEPVPAPVPASEGSPPAAGGGPAGEFGP